MKRFGCWIGHPQYGWEADVADVRDNALKTCIHPTRCRNTVRKRRTRTTMNKLRRSRLNRDLQEQVNEYFINNL